MKSGNLNFLEPSGPLQACNGTDLPLYLLGLKIGWKDGEWNRDLWSAVVRTVMNLYAV